MRRYKVRKLFIKCYNISIAVGTDRGLVVPVLRKTDEMSFADIEKNIGELGQKRGTEKSP